MVQRLQQLALVKTFLPRLDAHIRHVDLLDCKRRVVVESTFVHLRKFTFPDNFRKDQKASGLLIIGINVVVKRGLPLRIFIGTFLSSSAAPSTTSSDTSTAVILLLVLLGLVLIRPSRTAIATKDEASRAWYVNLDAFRLWWSNHSREHERKVHAGRRRQCRRLWLWLWYKLGT